ncbi:hypothetical protein CR513_05875, partial [Mucuna pruriens]
MMVNSTTSHSPFELVYGLNPLTSFNLLPFPFVAFRLNEDRKKKVDQYAKHVNKSKREKVFKEVNLAWVYLRKERFPSLRKSKLLPKGDGPFKILRRINDNAYMVNMPQEYGGTPTSNLRPSSL